MGTRVARYIKDRPNWTSTLKTNIPFLHASYFNMYTVTHFNNKISLLFFGILSWSIFKQKFFLDFIIMWA